MAMYKQKPRHALPCALLNWQPRPGERETVYKQADGAWEARAGKEARP